VAVTSAGPHAGLHLAPDKITTPHASTPPLCFLQAGCPSCRPTNSVKALKAPKYLNIKVLLNNSHSLYNNNNDRLTAFDPGQPG